VKITEQVQLLTHMHMHMGAYGVMCMHTHTISVCIHDHARPLHAYPGCLWNGLGGDD